MARRQLGTQGAHEAGDASSVLVHLLPLFISFRFQHCCPKVDAIHVLTSFKATLAIFVLPRPPSVARSINDETKLLLLYLSDLAPKTRDYSLTELLLKNRESHTTLSQAVVTTSIPGAQPRSLPHSVTPFSFSLSPFLPLPLPLPFPFPTPLPYPFSLPFPLPLPFALPLPLSLTLCVFQHTKTQGREPLLPTETRRRVTVLPLLGRAPAHDTLVNRTRDA